MRRRGERAQERGCAANAREEVGVNGERGLHWPMLQELGLDVEGVGANIIGAKAHEAGGGVRGGVAGGGGLRRAARGLEWNV